MKTTSLILPLLISFCGVTANGAVINADGHILTSPAHPGAILDTATHLLWLDASETKNRSLSDVTSNLGDGQEFEGWELASKSRIDVLFANAGLLDTHNSFVSDASAKEEVIDFVSIYGQTDTGETIPSLMGTNVWHADTYVDTNFQGLMSVGWITTDDRYWVGANGVELGYEGIASEFAGVALVRAVPEPTNLPLFTFAAPALLRPRRRRHCIWKG